MALKFKVGQPVSQVLAKPISGVVSEQRVVNDDISYLVEFVNESGQISAVWLSEDQLALLDPKDSTTASLMQSVAGLKDAGASADLAASEVANRE